MKHFDTIRYPIEFSSSRVLMHGECEDELESILERSGKKQMFKAALKTRLEFLEQHWADAPRHQRKWFEILKGMQGISSIRFITIDNIRILYILRGNTAFLLHAFKETSKATRNDPKSYKHACDIALTRINDIEEGEHG